MLKDINDQEHHAKELVQLINHLPCLINLM
jgi:adenine C2-methylase RlmN of 23S rRNA A2503 and tRNA A37